MGTWGAAIFSDDLALDIRDEFKELIGDGCSASQATAVLIQQFQEVIDDVEAGPVFWLALAAIQWKTGHVEESVIQKAANIIDLGSDLIRWQDDEGLLKKRKGYLTRLKAQLLTVPPPPKKLPKVIRHENDWLVGEILSYQFESGEYILFRVIGHHVDKGGRFPVCELLDWKGNQLPADKVLKKIPSKTMGKSNQIKRFMLILPRRGKCLPQNLSRIGVKTHPAQELGGFHVLFWKNLVVLLSDAFSNSTPE